MPGRIPHTLDSEVITGTKTTKDYLVMQKKIGKLYFKDFFLKFEKLNKPGRFLEVGPGPGYQTVMVLEKFNPKEIIGLEYSPDMIKVAEKYINEMSFGSRIKFINGTVEDTGLINGMGKFDVIYSTFSLHHWSNPVKGIKNLYNSLNKNGVLFIYDFFRGGIFYYIKIKRDIWQSIRASYNPAEIQKMLKELDITDYNINRKNLYMDIAIIKN
jgi:SAM-dependent methyltransferase